jgi:putative FmdB family regulatory protein
MPVYTYECDECGVRFDARQKFSDAPVSECPECGGHTHRVPQAVGIVFKGSGWYVTDSKGRNSLATPPSKKDEGGSTEKSSGSEGGSDASAKSTDSSSSTPKPSSD